MAQLMWAGIVIMGTSICGRLSRLMVKFLFFSFLILGLPRVFAEDKPTYFDGGVAIENIEYVAGNERKEFVYFGDDGVVWSKPRKVSMKVGVKNCGRVAGRVEVIIAMYALYQGRDIERFVGLGKRLAGAEELSEISERPIWVWQRRLADESLHLEVGQEQMVEFSNIDISDDYSPTGYSKHGFLLRAMIVPVFDDDAYVANNSDERVYLYEDAGVSMQNPKVVICPSK